MRYLALLRGINVGGNSLIKMADLRVCLQQTGFIDVETYIQSGNVFVTSSNRSATAVAKQIHVAIQKAFKLDVPVMVITKSQLTDIVKAAPKLFAEDKNTQLCDVIFPFPGTTSAAIGKLIHNNITLREGVDAMKVGKNVLFFSRLKAKASSSRLSKIISLPFYKQVTIRNWNTTQKLLAMFNS